MADIRIRVGAALDASVQKSFESIDKASEKARKGLVGSASASEKAWAKLERELESVATGIVKSEERTARAVARSTRGKVSAEERAEEARTRAVERGTAERMRLEQRAARAIEREYERAAREATGIVKSEERTAREVARSTRGKVRAEERAEEARTRAVERGTAERMRLEQRAARAIEREYERAAREKAKDPGFFGARGGRIGIGRRAAIGVSAPFAMAYGYGGAALSAGARAMGINTDLSGMAEQGIKNQALAMAAINAAPSTMGTSVQARTSAAAGLEKQAQTVGNETASSTEAVLEGVRKFVALTGDLDTARSTIGDIAKLSRATGTSLEDMGAAAAEVSNHLGNVPDKAASTMAVMRAIAGQGKLGAVEIRDMAVQMAKLASTANTVEGPVERNIALMGAMAQASKLTGGSASASQAATSVMRFMQSLAVPATMKKWNQFNWTDQKGQAHQGLTAFTDKSHTKFRDPRELILEMINATKGDIGKLRQLMPSSIGARVPAGFAHIYNEVGGGQKGLEAVMAEFDRLTSAAMTQEEVTTAFNAQMQTSESRVQIFNNHLQQTAEQLQTSLLPAFDALSPIVVGAAQGLSDWLGQLTGSSVADALREGAAAAGKEEKSEALLLKSRHKEAQDLSKVDDLRYDPNGKLVDVYSGTAVDTMKAQGGARAAARGKILGEIGSVEEEEAQRRKLASNPLIRAGEIVTHGLFGMKTEEEKANELHGKAGELKTQNDALLAENKRQNDLLSSISRAVELGVARLDRPPPPKSDNSGRERPEANVEP